jgi:hypothetical protein
MLHQFIHQPPSPTLPGRLRCFDHRSPKSRRPSLTRMYRVRVLTRSCFCPFFLFRCRPGREPVLSGLQGAQEEPRPPLRVSERRGGMRTMVMIMVVVLVSLLLVLLLLFVV